jgi:hypothetical protein
MAKSKNATSDPKKQPPGDPIYGPKDDIYANEKKVKNISPEDESALDDESDDDLSEGLDVPGSELDDDDERIGEEDEENNYYSIGGDNHDDLEEDKGD